MKKKFTVVEDGFTPAQPPVPIIPATNISIQVVDNGFIVQVVDVEGMQTLKVFNEDDLVEMLQAITGPLGYNLTSERVN